MSLHLSFLRSLSLWIIITYHTGLITASKRVSVKTLITVLGAEHSALIPSNTRMKRNSWEKQERKPVQRLFFNRKFVPSLNVINTRQSPTNLPIWIGSCFWWLFMIFPLCPWETLCFILSVLWLLCLLFQEVDFILIIRQLSSVWQQASSETRRKQQL